MDRLMLRFLVRFAIMWTEDKVMESLNYDRAKRFMNEGDAMLAKEQHEFDHPDNSM